MSIKELDHMMADFSCEIADERWRDPIRGATWLVKVGPSIVDAGCPAVKAFLDGRGDGSFKFYERVSLLGVAYAIIGML